METSEQTFESCHIDKLLQLTATAIGRFLAQFHYNRYISKAAKFTMNRIFYH